MDWFNTSCVIVSKWLQEGVFTIAIQGQAKVVRPRDKTIRFENNYPKL